MTLRWKSNNAAVADRAFTIARVVNGEIEIMPDPKTGTFVGVYVDVPAPAPVNHPPTGGDLVSSITVKV